MGEPPSAALDGRLRGRQVWCHLQVAIYFHNCSVSSRLSSAYCSWMYFRITASSRPTVETKYPRAQKQCPVKLRLTLSYSRASQMALFPLMYPTTLETEYFGDIVSSICT